MTTLTQALPQQASPNVMQRLRALSQRRATWVLMDQAIVSAGNFLTLRYLIVYLGKESLGEYGILLETINFLNSLQAALVVYPLTVRGASGGTRQLKRLAYASVIFSLLLLPFLAGALCISLNKFHDLKLAPIAIIALLLWQLQESMRRALMADLRFAAAVPGDAISYLGQAAAVAVLGHLGHLTLMMTFVVMAITSAAAMGVQMCQIGVKYASPRRLKVYAQRFWRLGRWMLPNNASSLITALGYWYTLEQYYGLKGTAMFTATVFFFKPANPIQSSMSSLVVPAVARAAKERGEFAAARQALRYLLFGGALLAPYFLLLAIAPDWCIGIASRGKAAEYEGISLYLRLYVVNYTLVYASAVLGSWLAGLGRSKFSFFAQIANIVATVAVGFPLTAHFGVKGLIYGGMVSAGACLIVLAWFLRPKKTRTILSSDAIQPAALTVAESNISDATPQPIGSPPLAMLIPPRPKLPPRKRRVR